MKQVSKSNLRENLKIAGIILLMLFFLFAAVDSGLHHNIFSTFLFAFLLGFGLAIIAVKSAEGEE